MAPLAVPIPMPVFSDNVLPVRQASVRRRSAAVAAIVAMVAALPAIFAATPALAANPDNVKVTLEGCRNDGTIPLPNGSGKFVCPDPAYTTGNLGKGWNELDLVPYKLTLAAGTSATDPQTYTVAYVVDSANAGKPGYDLLSDAVQRGTVCTGVTVTPSGAPPVNGTTLTPGIGGTGTSLYRLLTVTQAANTTCVFDFYARLAIDSHLYPGSSLHANMALQDGSSITTSGIGARDVSIPVKEISPQTIAKDMSASQDQTTQWQITKSRSKDHLTFDDTCSTAARSDSVDITVTWTKLSVSPSGDIDAITSVTATNPASRSLKISISDLIYAGDTPGVGTSMAGPSATDVVLPASTATTPTVDYPVITNVHTTVPASFVGTNTSISDRATATYTDDATGLAIPQHPTATDTAAIQTGTTANASVDVSDVERLITTTEQHPDAPTETLPAGVSFKAVIKEGPGAFTGGYTSGTYTTGDVGWSATGQTDTGHVTFTKTVKVDKGTALQVKLYDKASLSSGATALGDATQSVLITAAATTTVNLTKNIDLIFATDKVFHFHAVDSGGTTQGSTDITIAAGHNSNTGTISGLPPGSYRIVEDATAPYAAQTVPPTTPVSQPPLDLNLPNCSVDVTVNNQSGPATAQVKKVATSTATPPLGWKWDMTLTGPKPASAGGGTFSETIHIDPNSASYAPFSTVLEVDGGTYTITEATDSTPSTGHWDNTAVAGSFTDGTTVNHSTTTHTCSFTLNLTTGANGVLSCTFTNVQRGHVTVTKTLSGAPIPTGSTASFEFSLTGQSNQTANATNHGALDFGYLAPGDYTLCELNLGAAWSSTWALNGTTVTPYNPDAPSQDLGNRCYDFHLDAGASASFAIDNIPPPGGNQRTIGYWKNWNSINRSADFLSRHPDHFTVDYVLANNTVMVGNVHVDTVQKAVNILSYASTKYAEHGLAAQLLAAKFNVDVGAATGCTNIGSWITRGDTLLSSINYTDSNYNTSTIVKSGYSGTYTRADFVTAQSVLDAYNNGTCPAAPFV